MCRRLGYPWKVHGNKMVSVPTATIPSRSRGSNSGSIAYHLSLSAKIVGWFRSVERRNVRGFGSSSAMSRRLWGSSPRKGGARNSRLLDRLRPVRVDINRDKIAIQGRTQPISSRPSNDPTGFWGACGAAQVPVSAYADAARITPMTHCQDCRKGCLACVTGCERMYLLKGVNHATEQSRPKYG
jgi:hypothetical protein